MELSAGEELTDQLKGIFYKGDTADSFVFAVVRSQKQTVLPCLES